MAEAGVTPRPPEARYFHHALDLLCLAGVDGFLKVVNPAWKRALGWEEEELLATPYLDLVHPDDRDVTAAEASKLATGFDAVHFKNRYRCRDGSYRWLEWTASAAMADGTIYAGARDVTEAMLTEEDELEISRRQLARVRAAIEGQDFSVVFQPIVLISGGPPVGYEALSRFDISPIRSPDVWFAEADGLALRTQLEMRAIREALSHFQELPALAFLSINASAETMLTADFTSLLASVDRTRLVVEVTEHSAVQDYRHVQQAIAGLRESGVRLAIDDAGAGYSSLRHIVRLLPDFIKLDMFLTRDIDTDPVKRALATAIVKFAAEVGAGLIAEGVENSAEATVLAEIGFDHAQGYHFGRPGSLQQLSRSPGRRAS